MSFHEGSFAQRLGQMGDQAESVFANLNPNVHPSGLNRPPLQVGQLGLKERSTPDFLAQDAYVECMGIGGRSPSLKLKVDKALGLVLWNHDNHTDLFVWDSTRKRWWRAHIFEWINACVQHGEVKTFHDNNKPYWELKPKFFPVAATPIVEATSEPF